MSLQLIFVVEANSRCKSDWIYIKETIEQFYQYSQTEVKLSPVYMDGKGKYVKKEKEISKLISQYSATSKNNRSQVLYCFDCDDYDNKPDDLKFLNEAKEYCSAHGADFVWFCKDIERVYLGKKVQGSAKKAESAAFKSKNLIKRVDIGDLSASRYKTNTSNIMCILDKYLKRKELGPEFRR